MEGISRQRFLWLWMFRLRVAVAGMAEWHELGMIFGKVAWEGTSWLKLGMHLIPKLPTVALHLKDSLKKDQGMDEDARCIRRFLGKGLFLLAGFCGKVYSLSR